jgi:hypothetical protein
VYCQFALGPGAGGAINSGLSRSPRVVEPVRNADEHTLMGPEKLDYVVHVP